MMKLGGFGCGVGWKLGLLGEGCNGCGWVRMFYSLKLGLWCCIGLRLGLGCCVSVGLGCWLSVGSGLVMVRV